MIKKNMTFEDFLKDRHAEDYHGTDDDMPDAFEAWLGDISVDDLISLADEWHDKTKKSAPTFKEFLRAHHAAVFQDVDPDGADGYAQWIETMDVNDMLELGEQYGVELTGRKMN